MVLFMTKILLSGCGGKMGRVIASCIADREDCEIIGGIEPGGMDDTAFPVYSQPAQFDGAGRCLSSIFLIHPHWKGFFPIPLRTIRLR